MKEGTPGGFPIINHRREMFSHKHIHAQQEQVILAKYSPEEQEVIKERQKTLSSLGYFIGKDYDMPIYLNEPGAGWHWNFKHNYIKIDPQELLEKPMDYLRFVICHEGGHRRITRADFIPTTTWEQPGFRTMMNCIEDPRMNNFVAEAYPKFKEQMIFSYDLDESLREEAIREGKMRLGHVPKHDLAGTEYIRQWFREVKGEPFEIDSMLPEDVQEVVRKTLNDARESWWRYPSKEEADNSEDTVVRYAKASYQVNLEKIWPAFKELVEKDMENQELEEFLKDLKDKLKQQQEGGEEGKGQDGNGEKSENPENLGNLSEQEKQMVQEAIQEALQKDQNNEAQKEQEGQMQRSNQPGGNPIDLDQLPDSVKEKLKEIIDSLPPEERAKLTKRAEQALKDFDDAMNEMLQGKFEEDAEEKKKVDSKVQPPDNLPVDLRKPSQMEEKEMKDMKDKIKEMLNKNDSVYETVMQEVLPIIDELENDLREIFVARRAKKWETGFKTGRKIDMKKRIQEKAKDVDAFESRAWQKRERPDEKDYAITLLVDLSGSMTRGDKIKETFKAVVVLSEVLNKLSIKLEILGFNDRLHPYQFFGETLTDETRKKMGNMLSEVESDRAAYNDDGWALSQASSILAKQQATEKFLITLSDGLPEESSRHSGSEYELSNIIKQISETTNQKLIGLGIGKGTEHVSNYYPNSVANISTKEMAQKLADVIREAIANYENF